MEIRGKKYVWRAEDMDSRLLFGLFFLAATAAALSFWFFVCAASAILG